MALRLTAIIVSTLACFTPGWAFAQLGAVEINEVFPGTALAPNAQYIELDLPETNSRNTSGAYVAFYNAAGMETGRATFGGDLTSSNPGTAIIATTEANSLFGIAGDLTMTALMTPAAGKVCIVDSTDAERDCFSWGGYTAGDCNPPYDAGVAGQDPMLPGFALRRQGATPASCDNNFVMMAPSPTTNDGTAGTLPSSTCPNGTIEGVESCDDNNSGNNDGCAVDCTIEAGWTCRSTGAPCTEDCGDGLVVGGELCDDGNSGSNDGCSTNCTTIDVGYTCATPGQACVQTCGNDVLDTGEACDDGNNVSNDGCEAGCRTIETGYECLVLGQLCTLLCGNGTLQVGETCDDDNNANNDGCSSLCALDTGWECPTVGQACNEICGDGLRVGGEACDDRNQASNDGCAGDCSTIEAGYTCPTPGQSCVSVCGDCGALAVDDLSAQPVDPTKWTTDTLNTDAALIADGAGVELTNGAYLVTVNELEPMTEGGLEITALFTVGADDSVSVLTRSGALPMAGGWPEAYLRFYAAVGSDLVGVAAGGGTPATEALMMDTGDQLRFLIIDDGNDVTFTVTNVTQAVTAPTINTAVTDLNTANFVVFTNRFKVGTTDYASVLDDVSIRTLNLYECKSWGCNAGTTTCEFTYTTAGDDCDDGDPGTKHDQCDGAGVCLAAALTCGDGNLDAGEDCDDGNETDEGNGCSPLCLANNTCGNSIREDQIENCDEGGETATCDADCTDVVCGDGWVNQVVPEACDDGDRDNFDGCNQDCVVEAGWQCNGTPRSICQEKCGNSRIEGTENCDDGNTDVSDGCDDSCMIEAGWSCDRVPSVCENCGNGVVEGTELCDCGLDGSNIPVGCAQINSDTERNACRLTCLPAACGDGVIDSNELCDNGGANSNTTPDACRENCFAARCGDGVIDPGAGDECDDGAKSAGDGCDADCKEESGWDCSTGTCLTVCGDGIIAGNEVCDCGTDAGNLPANCTQINSDTARNACRTSCVEASCGDGVEDSNEACDCGSVASALPGGCTQINSDTEVDACRTSCALARCGDGVQDTGEVCDDNNTAAGDGCPADCLTIESGWSCGASGCSEICNDGIKVGSEECDCGDGTMTPPDEAPCNLTTPAMPNGNRADACRTGCSLPFCGDAIKDSGEACDDGNLTNDDSCLVGCTAPTCGDGFMFSVVEECDDGANNSDTAANACRSNCKLPTCGDGVLDRFEECDDGNRASFDECSRNCKIEEEPPPPSDPGGGCSSTGSDATVPAGLAALMLLGLIRRRRS